MNVTSFGRKGTGRHWEDSIIDLIKQEWFAFDTTTECLFVTPERSTIVLVDRHLNHSGCVSKHALQGVQSNAANRVVWLCEHGGSVKST